MVPDPNYFGGSVELIEESGRQKLDANGTTFGHLNWVEPAGKTIGNYRGLGLADLLDAAETGRQPRASGHFARHVLDVLLAIIRSAEEQRFVDIASTTDRPDPLSEQDAVRLKSTTAPTSFAA